MEVRPTLALGPGSKSTAVLSPNIKLYQLLSSTPTSVRDILRTQVTRGSSDVRTAKLLPLTMKCCDDSCHKRQPWGWKRMLTEASTMITTGIGPEQKSALLLDPGRKSKLTVWWAPLLRFFSHQTRLNRLKTLTASTLLPMRYMTTRIQKYK